MDGISQSQARGQATFGLGTISQPVTGGLLGATVATLTFVPAVFSIVHRRDAWASGDRRKLGARLIRIAAGGEIGTLTIGFFNGGTGAEVPNVIWDFHRRHPGVRVSVGEMLPGEQSQALVNGSLDIGFTWPLDPPFDELLSAESR